LRLRASQGTTPVSNDTGGKFANGVNNTGCKLAAGVNYTDSKVATGTACVGILSSVFLGETDT